MSETPTTLRRAHLGLMTPLELAELLEVTAHTLAIWRMENRGPDFIKLGRSIFYRKTDVEDWIAANVVVTKRSA